MARCQGKIALHIGNHSLSLRSQIAWAATITIVTDVLNGRWDTASSNRLTARRARCFLPELRSKPPMSYYNTSPLFFFAQVLARNISNPLNIDIFSKHTFHPPKNMELQPLHPAVATNMHALRQNKGKGGDTGTATRGARTSIDAARQVVSSRLVYSTNSRSLTPTPHSPTI